jgi:TetR/AcrR family transcriptional regulator, transcriptional repressor for nem operon
MKERTRNPNQTRQRIITAGKHLLAQGSISSISVNHIINEAGVAKGSFFHHFDDKEGFLVFLHQEFHEELFKEIELVTALLPLGEKRLWLASLSYLNFCIRERGARELLFAASPRPEIQKQIKLRNKQITKLIVQNLRAAGSTEAKISAELWIGIIVHCALLEAKVEKKLHSSRLVLQRILRAMCEGQE